MLVSVLASGSKGNSTLIKTSKFNLLIDAGMSVRYLETKLREKETLLKDIDYIFITHTHTDHVNALNNLIKKYNPVIVMTEKMFMDLPFLNDYDNITILFDDVEIGDVLIESIPTSHDASDGRGYIISEGDRSVVVITDTGYIHQKHFKKLKNKNIYVFESNYDSEMLASGSYPHWLKQRIRSDEGHLENEKSAFYLSKLIGPETKQIILAHLSEENNDEEKALESLHSCFKENDLKFNNVIVAKQKEATELIEA